jgi:hypothetical protein
MKPMLGLIAVLLAACAARSEVPTLEPQTWILPLAARDGELVCAITIDYPGRRCATVAEIRNYLRSVKAD